MNVAESGLHLRVIEAQRRHLAGDIDGAAAGYARVWDDLAPDDWWLRMLVAHLLADTCTEADRALHWDLQSLYAASSGLAEPHASTRPRHSAYCTVSLSSIWLSLGQGYRRTGRPVQARACLQLARLHEADVPPGRYRVGLSAGIAQLARKLDAGALAR